MSKRRGSDSGSADGLEVPEAKRVAVDQTVVAIETTTTADAGPAGEANGEKSIEEKNVQAAAIAEALKLLNKDGAGSALGIQPSSTGTIQPSSSGTLSMPAPPTSATTASQPPDVDPAVFIHLRIAMPSKEAVCIIGRGGEALAKIRDASKVRMNVSDNVPGVPERIVHLKGSAEHVAKASGLLVRTLFEESFDVPSKPDARPYNLKLLMPHKMMGALIGKGGAKFREIEEASAAKLKAKEQMLPFSTDRYLIVSGVSDAIHIAVYYLAITYLAHKDKIADVRLQNYDPVKASRSKDHHNDRYDSYRSNNSGNSPTNTSIANNNGHKNSYGSYGNSSYSSGSYNSGSDRYSPYNYSPQQPQQPLPYGAPVPNSSSQLPMPQRYYYDGSKPTTGQENNQSTFATSSLEQAHLESQRAPRGVELIQEVLIPNDSVGSVIGKGGQRIKDIRQFSGSRVKVHDPNPSSDSRAINITGMPENNQVAIYLINTRIMSERRRQ